MNNKIIKTQEEYKLAMDQVEKLMDQDPSLGTKEADQLELLALLIQEYEKKTTSLSFPTPIEAIKYRMEEQKLKQKDLIPFIGSKSKVSEVLSGRRTLSLPMIRALSEGLGIPLKVLIQGNENESEPDFDFSKFPIKAMSNRGWINKLSENAEGIGLMLREFLEPIGLDNLQKVRYRMTKTIRSNQKMDQYSLLAWTARIYNEAENKAVDFSLSNLSQDFMQELVKLSIKDNGPILAKQRLQEKGIALVIEPHLPHTYIDGAAILLENPIIGMTLRFDRIDNFWFTLMHELSHVFLHYGKGIDGFFDDLEFSLTGEVFEWEADNLAAELLIPEDRWERSAAHLLPTESAAKLLAAELGIHVAIVAGRIRKERKNFALLNDLIGQGEVKGLFLK
jgi:HTH-type transcriptional regulator/antitoxin HigA